MKKLFTLFLALAAGVVTMFADGIKIGDLYYNLNATDQTAEVTYESYWDENNYKGLTTANIPASVTYNGTTYSVTSIGRFAFCRCSSLTSVTIPNSVTSIGDRAFEGCSSLTSVTIPNSVTSIGDDAFYRCSSLIKVNITDIAVWCNIAFGDVSANPLYYAKHLFVNDVEVTDLVIPNSVTSIGAWAFYGCSGLTSIEIPNSVTSIGVWAFYGCSGLTSIEIPNSVTNIGGGAFYGCSGLTSVDAPAAFFDVPEGYWPSYTKILRQVKVNSGELTENALLFINRSYKTLQTLDVSGVTNTEFADEAFKDCYSLQVLVLPEGLQKVGYMMVAGCKNLQAIDIPASVEEIEQSAFEDCRSIKSITFGGASSGAPGRFNAPAASSQLKKIGNWAFYNCHALQNIVIPEGVEEIGDGAFYGCTYLEDVSIPASARIIGDNAFALCSKMAKMTIGAVVPPAIAAKTFEEVSRAMPVYVPETSVPAYKADPLWGQMNIIGSETAVETIGVAPAATKFLRNGEVLILRDGKMYNLQGVEVK